MVNGNPQKNNAVRPSLESPRYGPDNIPVPSLGGDGYSEEMRVHALIVYDEIGRGIDDIDTLPSARSCKRWKRRERSWEKCPTLPHREQ